MSRRRKGRPAIPATRVGLVHPNDLVRLNGEFYSTYPHDHFSTRLMLALAAFEADDDLRAVLLKGRTIHEDLYVKMDDLKAEELTDVARLEILSLSHHASETLLRLFYVHAEQSACPWLRLAELKGVGVAREIAAQVLAGSLALQSGNERLQDIIPKVCLGSDLPDDFYSSIEDPEASRAAVIVWLQHAADVVLSSPLYNAYKHGLTVSHRDAIVFPTGAKVGAVDEDGNSIFDQFFAFIRPAKADEAPAIWVEDRAEVDHRQTAGSVMILVELMDNILCFGAYKLGVRSNVQEIHRFGAGLLPDSFKAPLGPPRLHVSTGQLRLGPGCNNTSAPPVW